MNQEPITQRTVDISADSKAALATSRLIHRKILVRLFLGWLLLCITIGGIVLWLEINRFQQLIHELALKESATLSAESPYNLKQLDEAAYQHLTNLAHSLLTNISLWLNFMISINNSGLKPFGRDRKLPSSGLTNIATGFHDKESFPTNSV